MFGKTTLHKFYVFIYAILICNYVFCQSSTKCYTVNQNGNKITIHFTLPNYSIKDTIVLTGQGNVFNYIDIENFGIIDDEGFPMLPQLTMDIALPSGTSSISVVMKNARYINNYIVKPIVPYHDQIESEYTDIISVNTDYYNSNGDLYNMSYSYTDIYQVFGTKGIGFTIFPVCYNPSQNRLRFLSSADFEITYVSSSNEPVLKDFSTIFEENYLNSFFENYESSNLKSQNLFNGNYLMITSSLYKETLTPFANYKRNLGYNVSIITTEEIGNTSQAIKRFLQMQYHERETRPDFVLLVGDVDVIPASGGIEGEYENPLTDLDYSLFAGNDYASDVFLGRWSISSNQELANIINKTIFMETNIPKFSKTALFLSGGGDGEKEFYKAQKNVLDNTFRNTNWQCNTHFAYKGTIWENVLQDLEKENQYIIYRGHGGSRHIGSPFVITKDTIKKINKDTYPMFFSFACLTNDFGYNLECFGESWIRQKNGGVSFYGATTTTQRHTNYVIEEKILGDAFFDEPQLSPMINLGMRRYQIRFWSRSNRTRTIRHLKSYNLLGDPSFQRNGMDPFENLVFDQKEVFPQHINITYRAENSIENEYDFIVKNGAEVHLCAEEISLKDGFSAERGSIFSAEPCTSNASPYYSYAVLKNYSLEEPLIESSNIETNCYNDFQVYPNPTKDGCYIRFFSPEKRSGLINVFDVKGSKLLSLSYQSQFDSYIATEYIDLSSFEKGVYQIIIEFETVKYYGKIIKQ